MGFLALAATFVLLTIKLAGFAAISWWTVLIPVGIVMLINIAIISLVLIGIVINSRL